eukprot:TRINITY_DN6285_c0_g1_i1.p1 TRINITY_DN6285_c0_g1~~TRINITY_DN6285_c0_g1_i1.p1  ORF type:complete len:300 (-),score=17.86 TRINITY_DN6285_c0_g1_i1:192-1091(-)
MLDGQKEETSSSSLGKSIVREVVIIFFILSLLLYIFSNSSNFFSWPTFFNNYTALSELSKPVIDHNCRLFLGIFSVHWLHNERQVVRDTWYANNTLLKQITNCEVDVYFILGQSLNGDEYAEVDKEKREKGDIIILPTHENMNEGKSLAFFQYVAENFPDYTWVAKGDMDSFFRLPLLYDTLKQLPKKMLYGGRIVDFIVCGQGGHCPRGWIYMQGSFYILSMDLVQWIGDKNNQVTINNAYGHEDLQTGYWLHEGKFDLAYYFFEEGHLYIHPVKDTNYFYELMKDPIFHNIGKNEEN